MDEVCGIVLGYRQQESVVMQKMRQGAARHRRCVKHHRSHSSEDSSPFLLIVCASARLHQNHSVHHPIFPPCNESAVDPGGCLAALTRRILRENLFQLTYYLRFQNN